MLKRFLYFKRERAKALKNRKNRTLILIIELKNNNYSAGADIKYSFDPLSFIKNKVNSNDAAKENETKSKNSTIKTSVFHK